MITLFLASLTMAMVGVRFFNLRLLVANNLLMAVEKPEEDTVESPRDNPPKPPIRPNRWPGLLPWF